MQGWQEMWQQAFGSKSGSEFGRRVWQQDWIENWWQVGQTGGQERQLGECFLHQAGRRCHRGRVTGCGVIGTALIVLDFGHNGVAQYPKRTKMLR